MIHYWTDSPFNQYRNKTIFKIISCHEEYFGCRASWNYMESGHGKGPCDPIGGTAKHKADQAVKNGKYIIRDALDFFEWARNDSTAIEYLYISVNDYEKSALFVNAVCSNISPVTGTKQIHAVHSLRANYVWVRNTSCFCERCFNDGTFQSSTCCDGWEERGILSATKKLKGNTKTKASESEQEESEITTNEVKIIEPEIDDYVAVVYNGKVYIGKVQNVEEDEVYIHFLSHNGNLARNSKFKVPEKDDDLWIALTDILCLTPEPVLGKRALEIRPEALDIEDTRHRRERERCNIRYFKFI